MTISTDTAASAQSASGAPALTKRYFHLRNFPGNVIDDTDSSVRRHHVAPITTVGEMEQLDAHFASSPRPRKTQVYLPTDLLTDDTTTNRKAQLCLSDLIRLGPLGPDFIDVLRSIQNDVDGDFRNFAMCLPIFLRKVLKTAAASHPSCRNINAEALDGPTIDLVRLAIAGIEPDEIFEERGWDLGEAVAEIAGFYEVLGRNFAHMKIDPNDVSHAHRATDNEAQEAKRFLLFSNFAFEMQVVVELTLQTRTLLAGREENMERLLAWHEYR